MKGNTMVKGKKARKSIMVDMILISAILGLMVWQTMYIGYMIISSIAMILIGVIFLTSNLLKDKLFVSKASYWISINVSRPRSSINYVIWGVFLIIIGIVVGLASYEKNSEYLFLKSIKDMNFWLLIIVILILNIIIGLYTAKRGVKKQ